MNRESNQSACVNVLPRPDTILVYASIGVWLAALLFGLIHVNLSPNGKPMRLMAVETNQSPTPQVQPQQVDAPVATVPARPAIDQRLSAINIDDGQPTFDGRPLRKVRTIRMAVTAYSPDQRSCEKWADGITASGYSVWTNGMKLVAADARIFPFGSVVTVPGYNGGKPVPVLDRGGRIKGHRLDVLYPTHEIARQWGRRTMDVTVWEYAD